MQRLALILIGFGLVGGAGLAAAGCGQEEAVPVGAVATEVPAAQTVTTAESETAPPPTDADSGTVAETGSSSVSGVLYQVWLVRGESLFVTWREREGTPRVGTATMEDLLAGPTPVEARAGVTTVIPAGTRLLGLTISKGVATVDLSSEFESGGGSASVSARLAQVACTLDQFETVTGVSFELDGKPVDVFSGEGIVLDHPVRCRDYEELLPVILVEHPAIGQRVESGTTVSGSANVFEANVTVRVLDAGGTELSRGFTTATCGTGCRGTFSMDVDFEVTHEQPGTIVISDDDAAGTGKPPHEVRIPVTLMPS
ncbi:MAG TPA: Gmad2 immunoglobulin-like domain-containing protein [Gaiellaceae bacterium]|nr:Gmad2 immunoglobulin-like domain-containing protein [Gaiellaceae bacterium]